MNSFTITIDNCLDCRYHHTGGYVDTTLGVYVQCNMSVTDDLHYRIIADNCESTTARSKCAVPDWCPMLGKDSRYG